MCKIKICENVKEAEFLCNICNINAECYSCKPCTILTKIVVKMTDACNAVRPHNSSLSNAHMKCELNQFT